jgi:hypothetical protein
MKSCRHWFEDNDREICRATLLYCHCSGEHPTCSHKDFFNAPRHRLKTLRAMQNNQDIIAKVEVYK